MLAVTFGLIFKWAFDLFYPSINLLMINLYNGSTQRDQ